jgi:hypothetical protein
VPGSRGPAGRGREARRAGLRVAELCGLPRTVDLADLTREIFDVALVSERSARRTQVEGLLLALGTPTSRRSRFSRDCRSRPRTCPRSRRRSRCTRRHSRTRGGEDFSAIVEQALPDLAVDAPTLPQPVRLSSHPALMIGSLEDFPSPEDRQGLESALLQLMASTGAEGAELHAGRSDQVARLARAGKEDPLLKGLVGLALELNQPQVVSRVSGPDQGKVWGAWPFRTTQHRGVLAAAGIGASENCSPWERMVEDLKTTWDQQDREQAAAAFPMVPDTTQRWLEADEFAARLEMAVERNRRDGLRFAVHRFAFSDPLAAVERLRAELPGQLRDTDSICSPAGRVVLLLTAGPAAAFLHVRRRLRALWEQSWNDAALQPPAPPIVDQHIEMLGAEDAEGFLATAGTWLQER